ncbi:MAG: hypothetical protein ACE5JV_01350 [Nitrososphaerales archaeon]
MSDSEIAGNIIQILAGLPEFLRKPMLKSRMTEFFTLPYEEKREMVTNALNAAPGIDLKVLGQLVKTWMEVLCEFEDGKRRDIFSVYAEAIADSPDLLSKLETGELVKIFDSLPAEKKDLLAGSLRDLVWNMPEQRRTSFLGAVPENAKKILQL